MEDKTNNINNLKPNPLAIIISDVHLQDEKDELNTKILSLFENIKEMRPQYFLLLGDIFDFCFGGGNYFKEKYLWFYKELIAIQELGIKVFFVEGNHEFGMHKIGWDKINILQTTKQNPILPLENTPLAISHGDFFAAPWKYLVFRDFVKSWPLHQFCSILPGKVLDLYAKTHSSYSREKSESRELRHQEILSSALKLMKQHCPDKKALVFGHFHYPFEKDIDGTKMLSLHSWYKPNILCIDQNLEHQRVYL